MRPWSSLLYVACLFGRRGCYLGSILRSLWIDLTELTVLCEWGWIACEMLRSSADGMGGRAHSVICVRWKFGGGVRSRDELASRVAIEIDICYFSHFGVVVGLEGSLCWNLKLVRNI